MSVSPFFYAIYGMIHAIYGMIHASLGIGCRGSWKLLSNWSAEISATTWAHVTGALLLEVGLICFAYSRYRSLICVAAMSILVGFCYYIS